MIHWESNFITSPLINGNGIIKVILFLIIWGAVWLPIAFPLTRLINWHPATPISNSQKLTLIASLYLIAPLLAWGVMGQDLPEIVSFFSISNLNCILWGYVIGIVTIIFTDLITFASGKLHWQKSAQSVTSILTSLPLLLFLSFFIASIEELVFRGVFKNFLEQDYNIWVSAIASSAIFATLHLIWERKNTTPQLPGLFLMGLTLYYCVYLQSGNLSTAIGIHGGWVLSLATLDTFDLYQYQDNATPWLWGSKEKPLGSIAGIFVLIFTFLILLINK
ncbi:CPBP family intramembrane metalloprotease [Cyanobacterium stanieri LEGE 03274]|uniref:CPBP family intramembrane metalloprotease n=1 Tax=Cyanobacterium stanieri LEGE 03274 TaxID=1828756 RepID=A0ABR9V2Z4_9CHRO|nr:type II CAAX endopeptidase family protein [Cyanobacterium stanieri]MBE9222268.1 CPBP family intramembrane metalloprotease [Cyanobacterium stanieri LEGE 03274]